MDRKHVNSSNIESIGYDATSMVLEVKFLSGSLYQYFDITEAIYLSLINASSIGSYLQRIIVKNYRYSKIQ